MKASKSSFLSCSLFLLLLFLITSTILGIVLGKNAATNDFSSTPSAPTVPNNTNLNTNELGLIYENELIYFPISLIAEKVNKISDTIYEANLKNGATLSLCTEVTDCFINGFLDFQCAPPKLIDEILYVAISAKQENAIFKNSQISANTSEVVTAITIFDQKTNITKPGTLSDQQYFNAVTQPPQFTTDLSEFEKYMEPQDRDGYLILANSQNSVGKDYSPENLLYVERARYAEPQYKARLIEPAAKSLDAFLREAYACGYNDITVTSGYRSYADQEHRFNTKVNSLRNDYATLEEAQAAAATYIQWPGKSEHQTGLACDMHNLPSASTEFGKTSAAKWLKEKAHNFGFILRYPADKTDVTGISYEPWHFRFVGRFHATRMFLLDLTLEEYLEFYTSFEVQA